jgi:DNA-binding MarR family transcriptional regulator
VSNPNRPQAPGYLANLMARLFHELSGEGLAPLGIAPAMFPLLAELWFSTELVSRETLRARQEMSAGEVDALVSAMAAAGLIEGMPEPGEAIVLTAMGASVRDPAIVAARHANAAAASALSDEEMTVFVGMMNRVIDALQGAKQIQPATASSAPRTHHPS